MSSETKDNSRPRHRRNVSGVVRSGETRVVPQAVINKVQAYPIPKNVREMPVFVGILEFGGPLIPPGTVPLILTLPGKDRARTGPGIRATSHL